MAKKTIRKTSSKKKTAQKNYWKFIVPLIVLVILISSIFSFRFEIKHTYFKVKSTYVRYKNKVATKTEQVKIDKILKDKKDNLFGIDISLYQEIINWDKLDSLEAKAKIYFVIIRATAGKNKTDKYFSYNWIEAKKQGFIRGAYHYYRPNENSTKQANNFIENVKLEKGDIIPVLDIEKEADIQSMASLRKGITNWLNIVEAHYGVKPIIYSGDSFYNDHLANNGFDDYPIWIANYSNSTKQPNTNNWLIWQFTDKGKAKGISEFVDLNVFDGNEKLFKFLLME